jgi:hypothetical protein
MRERKHAYKILVGKSERKKQIGRPPRRWNVSIKTHVRKMRLQVAGWINLAQITGSCEKYNDSGLYKRLRIFVYLSHCKLLKNSAPCC